MSFMGQSSPASQKGTNARRADLFDQTLHFRLSGQLDMFKVADAAAPERVRDAGELLHERDSKTASASPTLVTATR